MTELEALKEQIDLTAADYHSTLHALDEVSDELKARRKAWEEANADLIEQEKLLKASAVDLKARLQAHAIRMYELTGNKTYQFLQAAETWEADYEEQAVVDWILAYASLDEMRQWFKLNAEAFVKWAEQHRQNGSVQTPHEKDGAEPLPLCFVKKYVGRVMEKVLISLFG